MEMLEWVISSAILTALVIALRFILKGKISLRLQYALWVLVLLRLLVPVNFGSTGLSVGNLTQKVAETETAQVLSTLTHFELPRMTYNAAYSEVAKEYAEKGVDIAEMPIEEFETVDYEILSRMSGQWSIRDILKTVWIFGIAAVGLVLFASNIRFAVKLRRTRRRLNVQPYPLPVYVSPDVDTPCLFGLFRPAIYVTPEAAADDTILRHTTQHELTHYRHGDHIWSLLRGACLALHWYNPLVWWAAILSRNDAELACDEATIKRIGEKERAEYGRTLIGMTCQKRSALLLTATTMTGSKSSIKERITLIAKKPKTAIYTLVAVLLIASIAVGCTFTGAREGEQPQNSSLSELAFDNLDVSEPAGVGIPIVYESDDLIIFYGDFGLFGYNLNEKKMLFNVDFIKAFGEKGSVQGEYGTGVVTSADGEQIVFTHHDPDNPEMEYESYFVDVPTLTYHKGEYIAPEDIFDRANAVGYIIPGGEIGGSVYIRGEGRWEIFAEYAPSGEEQQEGGDTTSPADAIDSLFASGDIALTLNLANDGAYNTYLAGEWYSGRFDVLLSGYEWTELEMPLTEPSGFWLTAVSFDETKSMTFWSSSGAGMVQYDDGNTSIYWRASPANDYNESIAEDVRAEYDNLDVDYSRISFYLDGSAEAAAEAFVHSAYGSHMMSLAPGNMYGMSDYDVVQWEVREVSADGDAVVGSFQCVFTPWDFDSPGIWAGNTDVGTGEYEGKLTFYREFVLQRQENGYWHCIGLGTGGYSLPE